MNLETLGRAACPALVVIGALAWIAFGPVPGTLVLLAAGVWACARAWRTESRLKAERVERRELSDQLVQSQKLAALGELSAGLAHEINNPLAIIGQEAELVNQIMGEPAMAGVSEIADMRDGLREILAQVARCGEITHKMLDFARVRKPVVQRVDLAGLIEDMVGLVTKEASRRGVSIERRYDPAVPEVATDPPLVRQVILNLLNNAAQALEKGGTIRIETGTGGGAARVTVSDNGPGIAPEHLGKIFNPFFTTKGPGQGTGLGLSICQRLVHELGGGITVRSAPGRGAAFTVTLPLAGREEARPWKSAA